MICRRAFFVLGAPWLRVLGTVAVFTGFADQLFYSGLAMHGLNIAHGTAARIEVAIARVVSLALRWSIICSRHRFIGRGDDSSCCVGLNTV